MYACNVRLRAMIQGLAMCQEEIIRCKVAANDFSARSASATPKTTRTMQVVAVYAQYMSGSNAVVVIVVERYQIYSMRFFLGRFSLLAAYSQSKLSVGRSMNKLAQPQTIYFISLHFARILSMQACYFMQKDKHIEPNTKFAFFMSPQHRWTLGNCSCRLC